MRTLTLTENVDRPLGLMHRQYLVPMTLHLDVAGEITEEEGVMFSEATFIS